MRLDPAAVVTNVGRRVAELRLARGLTQEQLAAEMGVSAQWISMVERGRNLTLHSVVGLANAFGVPLSSLLRTPKPSSRVVRVGRPKKRPSGRRPS